MISTPTRLAYAQGYLALDLFEEAAEELERVDPSDRDSLPVRTAWIELHLAAGRWPELIAAAEPVARLHPDHERAWIAWAYALRELGRVEEAHRVLTAAEQLHQADWPLLHYNLGCYACLLGRFDEARRRLETAFAMDPALKDGSIDDPDLKALRGEA